MKRKSMIIFLIGVCMFATTACIKTGTDKQKEQEKTDANTEESTQLDVARYQAYVKALSEIVEKQQWPDGTEVPDSSLGISYGVNQFAICDMDKDGKEELLIEINNASMNEMQTKVFDYDDISKQIVEEWSGLPGCKYYENGVVYVEDLHNQTPGVTLRPFYLFQFSSEKDTYEYAGEVYCHDRGATAEVFPDAEDVDGDGVIYYLLDNKSEKRAATKEEYEAWLNSYIGEANEVYVPYEELETDNIDSVRYYIESEEAVMGIRLILEKTVAGYDLTGDGKKDSIRIHCVEESSDFPEYGIKWNILINDQVVYEMEDGFGIKPEVRLYWVSEKRSYLSIKQHYPFNGDIAEFALYQTGAEQLERVCDFSYAFLGSAHEFHYGALIQVLTKDKITLLCWNQFNATAHMSWNMEFEFKDDKWILCETEHPIVYESYIENKKYGMTANQGIVVYETAACEKEKFIVKKGETVTVDRLSIENGKCCFRVRNSEGETGWFPDPEEQSCTINGEWLQGYFEEAMFAG